MSVSTSPGPHTSSTTTAGGTLPSRTRQPTGHTGSARTAPSRSTGWSAEGTLEDRIAELLESKRALAEAVVGEGEAWIGDLSDAELAALVQPRAASALTRELVPAGTQAPSRLGSVARCRQATLRRHLVGEGLGRRSRATGTARPEPASPRPDLRANGRRG